MKRSVKLTWSSIKTGTLIVIAASIALWASFTGGGTSIFESKKEFTCYFRNVDGLVFGSPVWMSGLEVGNVRSLNFVNIDSLAQVEVICAVKKSVWPRLTVKAEVLLGSIGFLGDKYIEIIPYPGEALQIEEGGIVPTKDAGDAKAVMKEAEYAVASTGSVIRNLDSLLGRMNRGEGTFGKLAKDDALYADLTTLLGRLSLLTGDLQKNQVTVVESLEKLSGSISSLADKVQQNSGTIGKLMNDPELYDNLASTTSKLDTIMGSINSAEGSLGLLVNDTTLYIEVAELMARINSLVEDIEENPRKYFKFSVF